MLNDLTEGVWLVAEQALGTLHRLAREPMATWVAAGERFQEQHIEAAQGEVAPAAGVAVISLSGLITPFPSLFSLLFGGGGGLQTFRAQLRDAVSNDQITAIVLNVNSPGGRVDLVPEVAAEVRAARSVKPVVAVANTLAASAAYWIASQADEVVVTPSGRVGSIGVFSVHEDWSAFNTEMGIAVTYISAGEFKVERNPDQPLSDEALQAWQREITTIYDQFVGDVAAGRGVSASIVRSSFGQGRCPLAADAKRAGMVDRIATLDDTINRVARARTARRGTRAEMVPVGADDYRERPAAASAEDDEVLEQQLQATDEIARTTGEQTDTASDDDVPPPAANQPDDDAAESYGLDTRRRRLSLVERALG